MAERTPPRTELVAMLDRAIRDARAGQLRGEVPCAHYASHAERLDDLLDRRADPDTLLAFMLIVLG